MAVYFVVKDVTEILGYANASKSIADYVDEELLRIEIEFLQGADFDVSLTVIEKCRFECRYIIDFCRYNIYNTA